MAFQKSLCAFDISRFQKPLRTGFISRSKYPIGLRYLSGVQKSIIANSDALNLLTHSPPSWNAKHLNPRITPRNSRLQSPPSPQQENKPSSTRKHNDSMTSSQNPAKNTFKNVSNLKPVTKKEEKKHQHTQMQRNECIQPHIK